MQIQAQKLSKVFCDNDRKTVAYSELTFDVRRGEFLCIFGPSGCGKTTLLRTMAGLETATSGELKVSSDKISMVFQEHELFPWMTLYDNVRFILENNPQITNVDDICNKYLNIVGLSEFVDYFPHQVSGGMRQRIGIARAFANDPDILLMDEPFIFLDYQARKALQQLLLDICHKEKKTVIFVTHNIEEAVLLSDRIMIMDSHPGKLKSFMNVNLPWPREVSSIRKQSEYWICVNNLMDGKV